MDSKGSRMDLILRLRAEMQNRQSYNKIFQKIWGASGKTDWFYAFLIIYDVKIDIFTCSPNFNFFFFFRWVVCCPVSTWCGLQFEV